MAIGVDVWQDYAKRVGTPAITITGDTDKITMSGWIHVRDITPGAYSYCFGVENADANASEYILFGYTNVNTNEVSTNGGTSSISPAFSQDTWYYVYITGANNGAGQIVWKAGYYTATGNSPAWSHTWDAQSEWTANVRRICIGNDSYNEFLDSMYAYVRVWTGVELSDEQLRAERDSATPVVTSGLWADWPLADNTDTGDDSGNGYDLTFGGTLTSETSPDLGAPPAGRTTKNTDSNPLGIFAGISRRVNIP